MIQVALTVASCRGFSEVALSSWSHLVSAFFIQLTFMTERFGQIFLALGLCRKEFEITQL